MSRSRTDPIWSKIKKQKRDQRYKAKKEVNQKNLEHNRKYRQRKIQEKTNSRVTNQSKRNERGVIGKNIYEYKTN